jgi:hypothetical protein
MLGRMHQAYDHLIAPAVKYGIAQRNIPYDQLYLTDQ